MERHIRTPTGDRDLLGLSAAAPVARLPLATPQTFGDSQAQPAFIPEAAGASDMSVRRAWDFSQQGAGTTNFQVHQAGSKWADETVTEDTPVRSYESYRHAAKEELGQASQSLLDGGVGIAPGTSHQDEEEGQMWETENREMVIAEQEIEARLMSGRLQSMRCQLEVQRQTSAKLAKMCKENKDEYEICVERMAEEAEAGRLHAYAVEQELNKRIHALEQSGGAHKKPGGVGSYVSIHGFSGGTARREGVKKEEYVAHLESDTARLKQKVADITSKLSQANVRGVKAETQLEKARAEHRASLDSMQQAQVELQNRIEDKETLIEALRNESDTRVWGVDKIREQYRDVELDRARLQQQVEQLKVTAAQQDLDITQLQTLHKKLHQTNKELDDKNYTLKLQVSEPSPVEPFVRPRNKSFFRKRILSRFYKECIPDFIQNSDVNLHLAQLEDAQSRVRQVESLLLNARKGDDELLHENRSLSSRLATVTWQVT